MDFLSELEEDEPSERKKWRIVRRGYTFGYQKEDDVGSFIKKTSWSLYPVTAVADPDIPEDQYVAYKGYTDQDKKVHTHVVIAAEHVLNFKEVKKCVIRDTGGSFILGELDQVMWKKYMEKILEHFKRSARFKIMRPVRNIGFAFHLLVPDKETGSDNFKKENIEVFLNPRDGILGADGQPKDNPISIYVPQLFPLDQEFVYYEESGPEGVLAHTDSPYTSAEDGPAYWTDINIQNAGLFCQNEFPLSRRYGQTTMPIIMGPPNCGKTSSVMAAAHLSSTKKNIMSSSTTPQYLMELRSRSSMWHCKDDQAGVNEEEKVAVEGFQAVENKAEKSGEVGKIPMESLGEISSLAAEDTNKSWGERKSRSGENKYVSSSIEVLGNLQIDERKHIVRRSDRKTTSQLLKEETERIMNHLQKDNDYGIGLKVEVFPLKGRGIVTTTVRRKGEFIVEYSGQLISAYSANLKEAEYSMDINKGSFMYYFKNKGRPYCVDATQETERMGRLLNHSCKHPNLITKVMEVNGLPRLYMVAKHDISAGTELTFDYGERDKATIKAHPWLAQ